MSRMEVKSFAKTNPLLFVGKKREDGFHSLFTFYQTLSLHDKLILEIEKGYFEIKLFSNAEIPLGSDNLVYKAVEKFCSSFGIKDRGFRIFIEKTIPAGGGLGGGSSNAGAVLRALSLYFGTGLSERLFDIASAIGSDVPFFLYGGSCLGFGRGEIVFPVKDLQGSDFLAVFPERQFATSEMYSLFDLSGDFDIVGQDEFLLKVRDIYRKGYPSFYNSFEKILGKVDTEIFSVFSVLRENGYFPFLSGSGSVFLVFGDNLEKAKTLIPPSYKTTKANFVSGKQYERLLFD